MRTRRGSGRCPGRRSTAPTETRERLDRSPASLVGGQPLELSHRTGELLGHHAGPQIRKAPREGAVVPAHVVPALAGSLPHSISDELVGAKGGADVVELVGKRDQQRATGCAPQPLEVLLLARAPGGLRGAIPVAALLDDVRDRGAVGPADVLEPVDTPLVLDRVVQQGGYGLVLGAAVLDHQAGDAEEMSHVRLPVGCTELRAMDPRGVSQRVDEAVAKLQLATRPNSQSSVRLHGDRKPNARNRASRRWRPRGGAAGSGTCYRALTARQRRGLRRPAAVTGIAKSTCRHALEALPGAPALVLGPELPEPVKQE